MGSQQYEEAHNVWSEKSSYQKKLKSLAFWVQDFICARAEAVRALYITFKSWCHSDNGIVLRCNI